MRYVIMADGKGSRWNNFMGHKKHDISVSGETLLERTVRLVHKFDDAAEIIITSHDESVSIPGAVRYEPKNNVLESLSATTCAFSTATFCIPKAP